MRERLRACHRALRDALTTMLQESWAAGEVRGDLLADDLVPLLGAEGGDGQVARGWAGARVHAGGATGSGSTSNGPTRGPPPSKPGSFSLARGPPRRSSPSWASGTRTCSRCSGAA
jgi:hypothetical protein